MTTNEVVSPGNPVRSARRTAGYATKTAAIGLAAILSLTACSAGGGYVFGVWDNGDPIYAADKTELWDENGKALCETPTAFGNLETRARSFSTTGGAVVEWLFEITNTEPSPDDVTGLDEAAAEAEVTRRERLQGSLERMYQLTSPAFDAKYGVTEIADMESIKAELQQHLAALGPENGEITNYVLNDSEWIEAPEGEFRLRRLSDAEGFIEENNIPVRFSGLQNTYAAAMDRETGQEYLLIRNNETQAVELVSESERFPVDQDAQYYIRYIVDVDAIPGAPPTPPEASFTVLGDQCAPSGGDQVARFWLFDYELLDGTEPEPPSLN